MPHRAGIECIEELFNEHVRQQELSLVKREACALALRVNGIRSCRMFSAAASGGTTRNV